MSLVWLCSFGGTAGIGRMIAGEGMGSKMVELANLPDHDLLVQIATRLAPIETSIIKIEEHQATTNGQIAKLNLEHARTAGSLATLSSLMRYTLAGIGAGAAVATVVLAIVARGI